MVVVAPDAQQHPLLEVSNLSKSFSGVPAVTEVSLSLDRGEVRGLVGTNGCGKSTLIKLLSGFHRGTPQTSVRLGGQELARHGAVGNDERLAFVHQDLGLVDDVSILENISLVAGFRNGRRPINWSAETRRAVALLARFGIKADVRTPVRELSAADRTLLAMTRALAGLPDGEAAVVVLDEPTSALAEAEVERILAAIRQLADGGSAVLFVSHRLNEILESADSVSVMREGKTTGTFPTKSISEAQLVEHMLGRPLQQLIHQPQAITGGRTRLSLRGLTGRRLRALSLDVAPGEIVGITGLQGSGKSEVARLVAGAEQARKGEILLDGESANLRNPREARSAGIAFVPPERREQGGIGEFTASENISLPDLRSFMRRGRLSGRAQLEASQTWMGLTDVRPADPGRPFTQFSGGNQQKIVFAKWLRLNPRVLILDEPTKAVDVGAVKDLYELVQERASHGLAVLLISSDWEDMARICHRVLVLDRGHLAAQFDGAALTADALTLAVLGKKQAS